MKRSAKTTLIIILLALIPVIVKLQMLIDPQRPQYQPGKGVGSLVTQVDSSNPVILPTQFVAGTVIGFREVVAGLLWIRANDFFHSGNYEAIVPLTRMITWLDPHQIDVYRTGSWHLAFNFVDSAQRADRRYLAPALKFMEEGIASNPGVSDLEFDLGFVLYSMKAFDFEKANYWIRRATQEEDSMLTMQRQLAHSYEKAGRIDDCVRQWQRCVQQAEEGLKKDPNDFRALDHLHVSKRNLDMTLVRRAMREDLDKHPIDLGFEAHFRRMGPRVFQISGKINLPDGARVDVMLLDKDYREPDLKHFTWEVDPDVTALVEIGMHGLFVENGEFKRKYDLTKDSRQYPFKKDKYILTLTFNPRTAPDYIQDRIGWDGEGMTDKNYLDTSVPGVRKVRKVIHLERKDII